MDTHRRWSVVIAIGACIFTAVEAQTSRPAASQPAASRPAPAPAVQTGKSYLDDRQRLKLFNLEQADLRLGRLVTWFADAVIAGNVKSVGNALAADFTAVVPEWTMPGAAGADYAYHALEPVRSVDRDGFLRWLEDLRRDLTTLEVVSFPRDRNGVKILEGSDRIASSAGAFRIAGRGADGDLVELSGRFTMRHRGMDEQYLALAGWMHELKLEQVRLVRAARPLFEDVTATCGVAVQPLHDNWREQDQEKAFPVFSGGVYLGLVNDDDHLDMLLTDMARAWLYLGAGDGTFRDSGWSPPPPTRRFPTDRTDLLFAASCDATGDGGNEVLCGGILYHWDESARTLVRVPGAMRLPHADAALGDYDRDGRTDLFLLDAGLPAATTSRAWFDDDRVNGFANRLLRNLGGGRFQDVTAASGASPGRGRTFAAVFFYADDDPWPDIFAVNEFGRNEFLLSRGDGTFRDEPEIDPVFGGFSMGVSSGDLDGDGRSDLYVSNMYSKAGHRVYHHLDLSLYPREARPFFMASINGNRLYRSRGDATFDDTSASAGVAAVGWGWSGTVADFDLDGALDIYAPSGHTSVNANRPDG